MIKKVITIMAAAMVITCVGCGNKENEYEQGPVGSIDENAADPIGDAKKQKESSLDKDREDKISNLKTPGDFIDKEELTLETPLKIADFTYLGESISDLEMLINSAYGKTFEETNKNLKQVTVLAESGEAFTISADRRDGVWTLSFKPDVTRGKVESTAACTWEFAGFDQDIKRKEFWPVCDKHEEEKGYYITSDEEKPSYSYIYASSTLFGASPDEDAPVLSEPIQEVRICYYGVEE